MAIKSKNSGAYADIVGVSVKTAGTYAAVQGIYAKSGGVYGSVYASGASPVLNASSTSGVAPLGIVFNAVGTTHPLTTNPFRDLLYFFDYGDGSAAVYTYGELAGLTKNRYVGGPVTAYVYEIPGTYTATVWAYDGVTLSNPVTQAITVSDPDVVYAGSATVVVSTSGNFTGAPAGSTQVTSSDFDAAVATHATTDTRLLFRDDEVFLASASSGLFNIKNMFFGRFGNGTNKPIVRASANNVQLLAGFTGGGTVDQSPNIWRIAGIRFESGGFTNCNGVSTGVMKTTGGTGDAFIKNLIYGFFTVHQCEFDGVTKAAEFYGLGNVVSSCVITNINNGVSASGGIGIWGGGTISFGQIDNYVDTNYGGEHCSRIQGADYWAEISNTYKKPAPGKNYTTGRGWQVVTQSNAVPCLYWVRGYNKLDATGIVSDTPSAYFHTGPSNTSSNHPIMDVIIEGNYFKDQSLLGGGVAIETCAKRTMLRGNVVGHSNNVAPFPIVQFANPNGTMTMLVEDNDFVGNTIYSSTTKGSTAIQIQSAVINTRLRGNLVYVPSSTKDVGNTGSGPTFVYGAGVNNTGNTYEYNSSPAQIKSTDPLFVGPLTSKAGFKLQAGSPYVGFIAADLWHFMDGAGFLLGAVPHDAGALNNVNKQVDAWSLIP